MSQLNIPNQEDINNALRTLRLNALKGRLASEGVDITVLSRQHLDIIMNLMARVAHTQEDYEIKQHAIQAEANRKIKEMITESNAFLADEYAKYNEIVSSYIHIPAQAVGPVPDPTVSLTALSDDAKTQLGDGVVVAPTDDMIPVPVVLNN